MATLLLGLEPNALPTGQVDRLRSLLPAWDVIITKQHDHMEAVLDVIEIAAGNIPLDLVERAPRLRWFQQWWAGADWLMDCPHAVEREFVLTNVSGIHAIPISEHVLALLLAFARGLPRSFRAQGRPEWVVHTDNEGTVFELAGKTMLLLGLGAIGQRTAMAAAALGMRVLGVRRNPHIKVPEVETVVGPGSLCDILPQADFVVLTLPLTRDTKGMIGADELMRMKSNAYLVNVGRGALVDEEALVRALREGWIAGAGLDVFREEPLPQHSPLWEMQNVIITAHYSGSSPRYNERAMEIFLDNLERYLVGQALRNVVDKRLGY